MDRSDRNELIDCLRALAITLVVLCHSNPAMAPGGSMGVSIFFVISGYLMADILMRNGRINFGLIVNFIGRRIARILPMLAFSTLVLALCLRTTYPDLYAQIGKLLFEVVSNPVGKFNGVLGISVLWTLVIEVWFYITFPFILWPAMNGGKVFRVFFALIAISIAAKITDSLFSPACYYDHFIMGSIVCAAFRENKIPEVFRSEKSGLVGLATIMIVAIIPAPESGNSAWFVQSLLAAAGTAMILASRLRPSMPVAAFLGRISYSIYLVHAVVLDVAPILRQNVPLYILAVVGISTVTYHLIEQPSIRLAHRYFRFSSVPAAEKAGVAA